VSTILLGRLAFGPGFLGGCVVEFDGLQKRLVDPLGAAQDGHDGCFPDQVGQGHDVAAGAPVEIIRQREQAAELVSVQAQRALEPLGEMRPVLALGIVL
jgi:hypothetical protein